MAYILNPESEDDHALSSFDISLEDSTFNDMLWELVVEQKVDELQKYITSNPDLDLNTAWRHGFTPLLIAIMFKNREMVATLLAGGVDASSPTSWHAFQWAVGCNEILLVTQLLNAGVVVNPSTFNARPPLPLITAVKSHDLAMVKLLAELGDCITCSLALHAACEEGWTQVVPLLLDRGADSLIYRQVDRTKYYPISHLRCRLRGSRATDILNQILKTLPDGQSETVRHRADHIQLKKDTRTFSEKCTEMCEVVVVQYASKKEWSLMCLLLTWSSLNKLPLDYSELFPHIVFSLPPDEMMVSAIHDLLKRGVDVNRPVQSIKGKTLLEYGSHLLRLAWDNGRFGEGVHLMYAGCKPWLPRACFNARNIDYKLKNCKYLFNFIKIYVLSGGSHVESIRIFLTAVFKKISDDPEIEVKKKKEVRELIHTIFLPASSLRASCRVVIRTTMLLAGKLPLWKRVDELPLPSRLLNFTKMEEEIPDEIKQTAG